ASRDSLADRRQVERIALAAVEGVRDPEPCGARFPVLTGEQPVVQFGGVHAADDGCHRTRDFGMLVRAAHQLGQDGERQRLARGRKGAPLIDRVVGRAIGRVDRARGPGSSRVRFDVGHEIPNVGHAIAFLYWGPTTVGVQVHRVQIRRRTTQRLLSERCGALAGPTTRLPERSIGNRDQRQRSPYGGTGTVGPAAKPGLGAPTPTDSVEVDRRRGGPYHGPAPRRPARTWVPSGNPLFLTEREVRFLAARPAFCPS